MTDLGELTYRRVHRASRELLFACLTRPEHLTHFWGPAGTSTPADRITVELKPGGAFETVMVNDRDGAEYTMLAVFLEVDPPGRLVWRETGSGMTTTITLTDLGDGTTEVLTQQTDVPAAYLSPEARAGFATSLDRCDRYIAEGRAVVTAEFLALAEVLDGRPDEDWDTPSLCAGWRVREVIAHLTMPARYGPAEFLAELQDCGGDFTRLSNRVAERDGARPPAALLADLRAEGLHRWTPPGGGVLGALTHVVIHGLDATVALGAESRSSDEALRTVLDGLTGGGGAAHFGVDVSDLELRATDRDWTFGSGTPLAGAAGDLAVFLCGRTLPPGRIDGLP